MIVTPLPLETRIAERADIEVLLTHADLTQAALATAQTIALFPVAAKMTVELKRSILDVPFADTTDAANNTNGVIVGDSGSTNRFLTTTELNLNGTYVPVKNGTGTANVYAATTTVDAVFAAPAAGKTLVALNQGQIRLLFTVVDERIAAPTVTA